MNFEWRTRRALMVAALAVIAVVTLAWPSLAMQPSQQSKGAATAGPEDEAIVSSAAQALQFLAESQTAYFSEHNEYATFQQLQQAGDIHVGVAPESMLDGYPVHWFLNEDKSDYAIIALSSDPELISFMIDSSGVLLALFPALEDYPGNLFWQPIIDAQTQAHETSGSYIWMNPADLGEGYSSTRLLLSEDSQSYIIVATYNYFGGIGGPLFASISNAYYMALTYDPDAGYTVLKWTNPYRLSALESRAKGTLMSIGSSELAYQSTHDDKLFGTFEQLQNDQYIAEGYTPDNMLEGYTFLWCLNENATDFAVVALPTEYTDQLRTYMVNSSQIVTELTPADRSSVASWPLTQVIDAESASMADRGEYDWVEAGQSKVAHDFDIFLSGDHKTYLFWMSEWGDMSQACGLYVYLSITDTVYSLRPVL
jgi:hypothetical protein